MSVFDIAEAEDLEGEARARGITEDQVQPGFFEGIGQSVGAGVMRGGAKAGRALGLAAAGATRLASSVIEGRSLLDPDIDTSATDKIFGFIDDTVNPAIDSWTPDAREVGTVGRVLGGLSEIVLPLAAGGGNPLGLAASTQLNTTFDLTQQGVDPLTAGTLGAVDAAAVGVGFKLPFLGPTFATKAATGAAGGLVLGTTTTALDQSVLEVGGYEQLAQRYDPFDVEARTVDLLTGIAFGGIAQLQTRAVARSDRDAALAGLNARHFQSDTAPGRPLDEGASRAHQQALETALRQLQAGQSVEVSGSRVSEAGFTEVPRETTLDPPAEAALAELGIRRDLGIKPAEELSESDRVIERRFAEQLERDPAAAMRAYAQRPDSGGGKILNTDTTRELSVDYLADRTKSAAVHEPASALVKYMYRELLREAPKQGEQPLVVFSAGGTGAGKSTGLELTGADRLAQIVYDSNMNSLESSVRRIEQALSAGKRVDILYTFRDPVEALTGGALPRAMRQEAQYGSGRTVPVSEHAKTHIGSSRVVREITEKYRDNPKVNVRVIDNSRGQGKAQISDLQVVPKVAQDQTALVRRLHEALDQEFEAGRISESVYRGFKGEADSQSPGLRLRGPRGPTGEGGGRPTEPREPDGSERSAADAVDPDVAAARQLLEQSDLDIPTGELDADGNPIVTSARELMASADAEVARATADAKGYEAAVSCLLSFGGS